MLDVTVRGTSQPGLVAIWEVHPSHPEGELWMVSGEVRTVALTPGVAAALTRGDLALVDPAPATEPAEGASPPAAEPAQVAEPAKAKPAGRKR